MAMIYENYMVSDINEVDMSRYELLDIAQLSEVEDQLRLLDYKLRLRFTAETQSEYKLNKLYKYKKYAVLRRLKRIQMFQRFSLLGLLLQIFIYIPKLLKKIKK